MNVQQVTLRHVEYVSQETLDTDVARLASEALNVYVNMHMLGDVKSFVGLRSRIDDVIYGDNDVELTLTEAEVETLRIALDFCADRNRLKPLYWDRHTDAVYIYAWNRLFPNEQRGQREQRM